MSTLSTYLPTTWTAVDLVDRFGAIPLERVLNDPPPGTATPEDVVRLNDKKDCLCELVDGTLVRKTMGVFESNLAGKILTALNIYLATARTGLAFGADGMMRLIGNQVRIPDVSFVANERLQQAGYPRDAILTLAPDLAVEVISPGNTKKEMERKLDDYSTSGVRLVWYVYPKTRTVVSYTSPTASTTLGESDVLTGGDVLPGFTLELKSLFEAMTP